MQIQPTKASGGERRPNVSGSSILGGSPLKGNIVGTTHCQSLGGTDSWRVDRLSRAAKSRGPSIVYFPNVCPGLNGTHPTTLVVGGSLIPTLYIGNHTRLLARIEAAQ